MLRQIIDQSESPAPAPQEEPPRPRPRPHRGPWLKRPEVWLALAGFAALGWLLLPWGQKLLAVHQLRNAGLRWEEDVRQVTAAAEFNESKSLDGILPALRRLQPEKLNLNEWENLTNVDGLSSVASLEVLHFYKCGSLTNLGDLKGLTSLRSVNIFGCPALTNLDGLKGLPALWDFSHTHITFPPSDESAAGDNSGASPASLDFLTGLTSLTYLNIQGWDALTNIDALKGLPALKSLSLNSCTALTRLDALKSLPALEVLSLNSNPALTDTNGFKHLKALVELKLEACTALTSLDGLNGLTSLDLLNLRGCEALTSVNGLRGLTALSNLNLRDCLYLRDVEALKTLTGLKSLDLEGCWFIPEETGRALIAALPGTGIVLPDGSMASGGKVVGKWDAILEEAAAERRRHP